MSAMPLLLWALSTVGLGFMVALFLWLGGEEWREASRPFAFVCWASAALGLAVMFASAWSVAS